MKGIVVGWLNNFFRNATRDEALRLGLAVRDVERERPVFNRANRFESLALGPCVRYSLPRAPSHSSWELLQRDTEHGAQFPNGYLLKSAITDPQFVEKFRPVADAFSEEYFEFEGISAEVAVFWEEWGGAAQAAKLHQALTYLNDVA